MRLELGIGMFAVTSRLWLVGREATTDTPLWPGKSVVFTRVSYLPELVFSLLIEIQEMYSDTLKEDIFIRDICPWYLSTRQYNLNENILTNKEEMISYTENYR